MIRDNPDFSADCVYVADHEQPSVKDPDLLKIYVSFEKEEDLLLRLCLVKSNRTLDSYL
jgi:hypothetical protein